MKNVIGVAGLLQRTLEGLHQMVGKLPDKADRIRQQNLLAAWQLHPAGGGIQCGEQLIFRQDTGSGQGVQQGRLARVGVAYDGRHRHTLVQALLSRRIPVNLHLLQFPVQSRNAALNQPSVRLQLLLAGTSGADTAAQS